jgi:hypothetical protein
MCKDDALFKVFNVCITAGRRGSTQSQTSVTASTTNVSALFETVEPSLQSSDSDDNEEEVPEPSTSATSPVASSQKPPSASSTSTTPPVTTTKVYRKHPKKDPNAPVPPRTAYQNFMASLNRAEMKEAGYTFSDIAKIASQKWNDMDMGK